MQRTRITGTLLALLLAAAMSAAPGAVAQTAGDISLDEAFAAAARYEWGESRLGLTAIERAVFAALGEGRTGGELEERLIELLTADSTTRGGRDFACRQLRLIGTEEAVPALVSFLFDPAIGSPARIALENIPDDSARLAVLRYRTERMMQRIARGDVQAKETLAAIRDPGLDGVLASMVAEADEPRRALIAELLGRRGAVSMAPTLESLAIDGQPSSVRTAALLAMAELFPWNAEIDGSAYLERALSAARSAEEHEQVLDAIERAADVSLLPAVQRAMRDSALGARAAEVVLALALADEANDRAAAKRAIEEVAAAFAEDSDIRRQAGQAIARIERNEGFITEWLLSGPYLKADAEEGNHFAHAFAPEVDRPTAEWSPVPDGGVRDPGIVDFIRIYSGNDRCAYAWTVIHSQTDQAVQLQIGSDDGVKVWLNGEPVHANDVMRGLTLNSDSVDITLKRGRNDLLVKIIQGGGDWQFAARLRDRDGFTAKGITCARPTVE